MLKHHIVADGANPITQHFHLVRQAATAGQQHVWKIYDAKRIKDGKVCNFVFSSSNINYFINKNEKANRETNGTNNSPIMSHGETVYSDT